MRGTSGKSIRSTLLLPVLSGLAASVQAQSLTDQVTRAIGEGSVNVAMRLRQEMVSQDNALQDASATTLKTRLSLRTATVSGLSALLEMDNVAAVLDDHYDSLVSDQYRGTHSVIADPVGSEVNQALLSYGFAEGRSVILGRQRILHGGQRFVGGVAWRQNEQTFDAVSYQGRTELLDVDYSYLWNVNRVFGGSGTSVQPEDLDSDSHILQTTYKADWGSLSGFAYGLDFDNAPSLSSLTLGASYSGRLGPFSANASLAVQSDHGSNRTDYNTHYLSADLSYPYHGITAQLGYEVLGSDDGIAAFSTPLATLHKFQGWADMFLVTPAAGIEDAYLGLSGKLKDLSLSVTFHDFQSAHGNADLGSEWDLVASIPINSRINAELKYATYDRDSFAVDTEKLWFSLNLAF